MSFVARDWRLAILAVYTLAVLGFMMSIVSSGGVWLWELYLAIIAWAIAPVALLCLVKRFRIPCAFAAIALSGFGIWAYYNTFIASAPDAQMGLVLVFVPLWQLIAAIAALGVFYGVARVIGIES
ncbi:hypothetical protein [Erythrobacter sp. AP23]|uniref:hypothetical protein n=1 Tax=Erythrobacter sp. AP23 TaxID=499656 RepID=UPI00076DCAA9|nr:hypothetical protein [Erythrobacter sp. AP23]KWV95124.1 hypothetical protein ASS64_08065 [Erythrobacter sp. AP23]